jgi:hypothetical protein
MGRTHRLKAIVTTPVVVARLDPTLRGFFDGKRVLINPTCLPSRVLPAVTVVHELMHAAGFTHDLIDNVAIAQSLTSIESGWRVGEPVDLLRIATIRHVREVLHE